MTLGSRLFAQENNFYTDPQRKCGKHEAKAPFG